MTPLLVQEYSSGHTPESLAQLLQGEPGCVLLQSALFDRGQGRCSFVTARPFLTFESRGAACKIADSTGSGEFQFGNPWSSLERLMERFEVLDELDLPFPLGGCFGFWGYDLKNFSEPKLSRRAVADLEIPDCCAGFYGSLVAFDHTLGKQWIISTGISPDGSRSESVARKELDEWKSRLESSPLDLPALRRSHAVFQRNGRLEFASTFSRERFIQAVSAAQAYICAGDIYQVNLSQRLSLPAVMPSWELYLRLTERSPSDFAAFLNCGSFQLASSSPERFLRLSGSHIQTRPIKGTRPRSADPMRDAQLSYELQTSPKETAELIMITDLLRNDLGKVCQYGSVQVPELIRLERFAQVQHLVSTVEGELRPGISHLGALEACFPGGSITGAPKFRAMEIIDELEPVTRGPYTGCLGYIGFNRESQLSITIRTALCRAEQIYFHVGAGIVADSSPEAEYEETLTKGSGLCAALEMEFDFPMAWCKKPVALPAP